MLTCLGASNGMILNCVTECSKIVYPTLSDDDDDDDDDDDKAKVKNSLKTVKNSKLGYKTPKSFHKSK